MVEYGILVAMLSIVAILARGPKLFDAFTAADDAIVIPVP